MNVFPPAHLEALRKTAQDITYAGARRLGLNLGQYNTEVEWAEEFAVALFSNGYVLSPIGELPHSRPTLRISPEPEVPVSPREDSPHLNRPFLREMTKRLGYSVTESWLLGGTYTWDWGPKPAALSTKFATEEAAWRNLENEIHKKCIEADRIHRVTRELARGTR